MKTEKIKALKNIYKEALHCMLRLHVDAPLNLPELNLHQRLQLQVNLQFYILKTFFPNSLNKILTVKSHTCILV